MDANKIFLLLNLSLDKIPADKVRKFTKRNGEIGMSVTFFIIGKSEKDKYGRNLIATMERESDEPTIYVGHGLGFGNISDGLRIKCEIEPTLIPRDRRSKFTRADGSQGIGIDLVVYERAKPSQSGQHFSISINQSKEERDANQPKIFIGGGTYVQRPQPAPSPLLTDENDDLPF